MKYQSYFCVSLIDTIGLIHVPCLRDSRHLKNCLATILAHYPNANIDRLSFVIRREPISSTVGDFNFIKQVNFTRIHIDNRETIDEIVNRIEKD